MNEDIIRKCDENIPDSLKKEKRWCLYKLVDRKGKITKIPITITGDFAKVNDISTFSTYENAKKALSKGVGFGLGFLLGDGYVGIDIDKVDDEISKYFSDENAKTMTADFLSTIDTYGELSPSKKGIHLIGKGKISGSRRRYKNLEIYEKDRFFTVTGDILRDKDRSKINDITDDLDTLYQRYMPKESLKKFHTKPKNYKPITFTENNTPLDMLFKYGYFNYSGDDLKEIYNGNFESYFGSQSEADFFMLKRLLYYTAGDVESAISYMESSGLVRGKWYRKYTGTDYIHYIAYRALNTMNKFYDWDRYNNRNYQKEKEDAMRRYESSDIKNLLSLARDEIRKDTREYSSFLKTMGNNYKYPYVHQLSIYTVKPHSTACAEYDYWKKLGRAVKSGEKGIPLLDFTSGKVKYIFDVKQTTALKYEITRLNIFEYKSEKHSAALGSLIDNFKELSSNSLKTEDEKINTLSKLYAKKHFNTLLDNLSDETLQNISKVELLKFSSSSLRIGISERLGINSDINTHDLSILNNIKSNKDIDTLLSYISKTNKNILLAIGKEVQNINSKEKIKEISKKEQTKDNDERYNDEKSKNNNLNEDIGGIENGRNSNSSRGKISERYGDIHASREREPIRENGRNVQNGNNGRWQSGSSDEYENATDDRRNDANENTKSKAELSKRRQGNGLSDDDNRGNLDGAFGDDTRRGRGLYGDRRSEDDEILWSNGELKENGLREVRKTQEESGYGTNEHRDEGNSLSVEKSIIDNTKKEVEKSTSFLDYKDDLIGLEIDYNGKRHIIESFHDDKIVLNEILTDETMKLVFGGGYHKDIFISDVEDELLDLVSSLDKKNNQQTEIAEKNLLDEKIAVKVGYYYALLDKEKLKDVKLSETGISIYPQNDNFKGSIYPLYAGETFGDSREIDKFFDELANEIKNVDTDNSQDLFDMNKQGLFEISEDTVTSYQEGYDFKVSSFSKQFPDYYDEIYISNKNLTINDANQSIAYIGKDNEIAFNVELPEEEKEKIVEIKYKKEVISALIDKDIKEKSAYYFDSDREIYTLSTKTIEDGLLQKPVNKALENEVNKTYSAELVFDFKTRQLRQNLKYGDLVVKTNNAITYKSQNEILKNLPYLLDDNHRFVMLEGFINQEIEFDKERLSNQKSPYDVGTKVRYNGLEYEISRIDDKSTPKEIELEDKTGFMNGFIIGSQILLFNDYNELDLEIIEDDKNLNKSIEDIEVPSQPSLENIFDTNKKVENKETQDNEIKSEKISSSLKDENRSATDDEKEILSKYVGWGGLADAFDENKGGQWENAREFLKENLSISEYEAARESTLTAFYTPKVVIDSMYKAISNMGFVSGNILEPALGTGRFIGSLPDSMKGSKFYGSEIDKISGEIAKALYPKASINIEGFEKTKFSNNLFDLAVGNVPFGDFKLADREYDKNNFLIHDYFFAKTLDKVRSGGVVAFITSSGTMDKQSDDIRRYISERAEFLGAKREIGY